MMTLLLFHDGCSDVVARALNEDEDPLIQTKQDLYPQMGAPSAA